MAVVGVRATQLLTRAVVGREIRRFIERSRRAFPTYSAEQVVSLLFSPGAREIEPWQHESEFLRLAREVERVRPATVLEIGTAKGGSLFMAAALADDDALIVSIDLPLGNYGGGYPDWKVPLYQSFARARQRIELLRMDSHTAETVRRLADILGGRTIDYMFIDGDHTYDGVRSDFERYRAFLSKKAIVAFHDIVTDKSSHPTHFVSEFWNEVKHRYPHKELVEDPAQDKLGIGVLFVGYETAAVTLESS